MDMIVWDNKYITGIDLIDSQHKQLVDYTNELYNACLGGDKGINDIFKNTMSHVVDYVLHHFNTELELLKKINFPKYHEHKVMHDTLIKEILSAANDYKEGKQFVPNHFVRILKDWVFSHVAVYDKEYALYVKDQKRLGLLTGEMLACLNLNA
ncbi:MAG: bacteriohemerythrin [Treponema sp.]|nr:bacteriohemerythrin [Treponema sp.]